MARSPAQLLIDFLKQNGVEHNTLLLCRITDNLHAINLFRIDEKGVSVGKAHNGPLIRYIVP